VEKLIPEEAMELEDLAGEVKATLDCP